LKKELQNRYNALITGRLANWPMSVHTSQAFSTSSVPIV